MENSSNAELLQSSHGTLIAHLVELTLNICYRRNPTKWHHPHPPKPRQWSAGFVLLLSLCRFWHHPRQLLLYLFQAKLSLFVGCAVNPVVAVALVRVRGIDLL